MYKIKRFFRNLFSFSGYISKGEFWAAVLSRLIGYFCAVIVMCILICSTVEGETQELVDLCTNLAVGMGAFWLYLFFPLSRRRLRDAGYSAKAYWWLLLPVVGWICFIVRLSGPSVAPDKDEILKFLK